MKFQVRSFLASRFELSHSSARIVPFEGLRGFAILLVFFVHFGALFGKRVDTGTFLYQATAWAQGMGHAGVEVFFFLSGYLIYGIVMRDRFQYGSYLLRRLSRLYPTFLTVTATILALCWIFPQSSKLPALALDKFLYIAANLAMLPGILNIDPLTAPAWSLSYEMLFYFSLPLIIAGLGMRRWAWWHRIVFFLSLSAVHAFLCAVGVDGHVRFIMFTGGMVLCEIARNCNPAAKLNSWGERAAIAAFLANLAAIGIAFSDVVPTDLAWVLYSLSLLVTVFFLILHAVFFDGILRKFFSFDYLRWLGNMSYSYYLSHGITVHGIQMVMDSRFAGLPRTVFWFVIAFVVCVIGSVVVGALLFLGVEKPLSLTPRAKTVRQPIAPPVPVE